MATRTPPDARSTDRAEPPSFLQLAGHPLRWRLLGELSRSDRRVNELTQLVGEPQNLVSYHLAKLRDAELVRARRSSADGRDAYYSVDLDRVRSQLVVTGAALHPAVRLSVPAPDHELASGARVLFLCTGNSARSQMAEALTVALSDGEVDARSAGSHPKPLHPMAVRVMRDGYGIDLTEHRSKDLRAFTDQRFDRVISLCDRVREICPSFPGQPETAHWSMPDPAAGHDRDEEPLAAFERTAAELRTRIGYLLPTLTHLNEATSA